MPIGIEIVLNRIADEYEDACNHLKRELLEYILAIPETEIRDPVQVRTRGRPSSSTQRLPSKFDHATAALDAPVHRRTCRHCRKQNNISKTAFKKQ
ncbi:unnamed protein product [Albugo candida]|uniref:Uncharacterized protein n=1 Tax=Albugo candida TaxID=65357 RepID=A0A024GEV6_9STRA|nr:unnamed protein product [Albugo candida]|eukprot:CCI45301.1 unnamed protein product [Albugo candida]